MQQIGFVIFHGFQVMGFTAAELAAEARRELVLRKRVYPNRVHTGRMTAKQAQRQIALMEAIIERLEVEEVKERLI